MIAGYEGWACVRLLLALAAVAQPTAGAVLDKVPPLLTLVLGYFFGQEVRRVRS